MVEMGMHGTRLIVTRGPGFLREVTISPCMAQNFFISAHLDSVAVVESGHMRQ